MDQPPASSRTKAILLALVVVLASIKGSSVAAAIQAFLAQLAGAY